MRREIKQSSRPPAPRFRGRTPRFQRQGANDNPGRHALRGLVRLLARQAAREFFNDNQPPKAH